MEGGKAKALAKNPAAEGCGGGVVCVGGVLCVRAGVAEGVCVRAAEGVLVAPGAPGPLPAKNIASKRQRQEIAAERDKV
eukprot:2123745-Rhodomonas_salina.1